ncbi:hypothetical protein WJX84_004891 [Apatococcus fuscideae]|uniref:Uncharacterized protein n=1 Tax=Apatococcus fuscideae TaxID=2026836 RepID=A0AAW1RKB5_9CHLO
MQGYTSSQRPASRPGFVVGPECRVESFCSQMCAAAARIGLYTWPNLCLQYLACIFIQGDVFACFDLLGSSAAVFLVYSMLIIIQIHPWYQPQYFIPVLGMLLGNAISGISVGLSTVLEELSSGRERMELLLALGAGRMEATIEVIQRAARVALTPILNQMSVVGLVSIPGMMTGQILSGSHPSQAARYQMIVMFAIAATTATSSVSVITLATFWIVDDRHRIRNDRLLKKKKGTGPLSWIIEHAANVIRDTWQRLCGVFRRRGHPAQGSATSEPLLNEP